MKREEVRRTLRLPTFLDEWLRDEAAKNYRSMNSQIVVILGNAWADALNKPRPAADAEEEQA